MENDVLKLPRHDHGPMCCKILHDFIMYHELPLSLQMPTKSDTMISALSKIFDIMIYSMGKENREKLINECILYSEEQPPSAR